jgi:hypothetical protein
MTVFGGLPANPCSVFISLVQSCSAALQIEKAHYAVFHLRPVASAPDNTTTGKFVTR